LESKILLINLYRESLKKVYVSLPPNKCGDLLYTFSLQNNLAHKQVTIFSFTVCDYMYQFHHNLLKEIKYFIIRKRMSFKCFRCGFAENRKDSVLRHLQRKKECDTKFSSITRDECYRMIKNDDYKLLSFYLLKEMEKSKETHVNNGNGQVAIGDNVNMTNNSNNTYNIEIKINSFEKTDYSVLKDKIHTCIKDGVIDEVKLIKLLHFNKDAPQNHNVMIENKRDKTIKVFNGEKFEDSDYKGREGIWEFSKDTITKTGEQEYVGDGDDIFIALENTKDKRHDISKSCKVKGLNKMESLMYNGKEKIKETHKL
jgi:hypothetical protein